MIWELRPEIIIVFILKDKNLCLANFNSEFSTGKKKFSIMPHFSP